MKIIFFGASRFILPLVEMLHKNFDLALVVTTERDPLDAVPTYCQKNNIPYISVTNISQALDRIKKEHAELGILAYFGLLLPQELLNIFPKGILNIHPSLLPKYRGAMPVQTAILNGDQETGVTIIKLDEELDHGPILAQEDEKILPNDTAVNLYDRLFTKGTNILQKIIPEYLENKISPRKQEDKIATYTQRNLTRQDGFIDINKAPEATILDRMTRAYYPWPTVWTLLRLSASEGQAKRIKFLPEKKLQVEGKKPVSLKDFINGYPETKKIVEKLFGILNT
jgi:methionyl-tRNA formyltransferase